MSSTIKDDKTEKESSSLLIKFLSLLLVGMISTTFAEMWLGFVFIMPNTVMLFLFMIPFYGLHVIFYYNLALYFRRTSFVALYWWGTLFGLVEAWVTTMVYYGYVNVIGHHGEYFGIAIYEYFANVFFWHPMNSFILTLMTIQILFYPKFVSEESKITETKLADTFVYNTKRNRWFWIIYAIYAGGMITSCTYGFEFQLLFYYSTFYLLILVIYFVLRKKFAETGLSPLHVLRMSKKGLYMLGAFLGLVYILSFLTEIGGKPIYNPLAFLIIFLTYVWCIYLVKKSKYSSIPEQSNSVTRANNVKSKDIKPISVRMLLLILVAPLIISLMLRVVPILAWIWGVISVELTMVFGIILLGVVSYKTLMHK